MFDAHPEISGGFPTFPPRLWPEDAEDRAGGVSYEEYFNTIFKFEFPGFVSGILVIRNVAIEIKRNDFYIFATACSTVPHYEKLAEQSLLLLQLRIFVVKFETTKSRKWF